MPVPASASLSASSRCRPSALPPPQDEMVPVQHMFKLHGLQRAQSCDWVECPNASHMDAYDADPHIYWPALTKWLRERVEVQAAQ